MTDAAREAIARLDYDARRRARQVGLRLQLAAIQAAEDHIAERMLRLKNMEAEMLLTGTTVTHNEVQHGEANSEAHRETARGRDGRQPRILRRDRGS